MPIYVYRNLTTGETFEIEQRITEDALTEHPETGHPVKRLIQPVGIAFKGSGFYVTDSRSSNGAAKGKGAGVTDKGDKADKGEAKVSESTGSSKAVSSDAAAGKSSKGDSNSKGAGSGPSGN